MMAWPGGFVPPASYCVGLFLLVVVANYASVDARILEVSIPPLLQTSPPKGEVLFIVTHDPEKKPQSLELPCKADGLPPPVYSWTKNGRKLNIDGVHVIQKENSGTIIFRSPKSGDEGDYQCIARNTAGAAYSDVSSVRRAIAVAFPKGEPRVVTVDLGDPLELSCENPGGYPKPSLHWVLQKSDGSLRSVTSPRATVDEEGTLWFSAVTLEDASEDALYACAASSITRASFVTVNDLAGRTEYRMGNWVYLNVSLPPESDEKITLPEIIRSEPFLQHVTDGNRTVLKGQSFRLYCIYGGYPDINTRWWTTVSGPDLTEKLIEFGKALEFNDAQESDEGSYFCQASNEEGQSDVKKFYVRIEEPPKFIQELGIVNQPAGESATFHCVAVGKPQPNFMWSLNGVLIRNEHQSVLKFNSLKPEDKGVIGCNASNPHGYVYTTGFLNVLSLPPEIITPPRDHKEFRGAPVTLTCEAYGAPDPVVSWEKISNLKGSQASVPISSGAMYEVSGTSLHIKALTEETVGHYLCLAKNKFTSVFAQAEVSLIKYTRVNLTLSSANINVSDSATLTCIIEGDSKLTPNVFWLKNEEHLNLSDPKYTLSETSLTLEYSDNDTVQTTSSLTVENAKGSDSGVYSCIAKTTVDETEDSQILSVQDVPDSPILEKVECGASEAFVHWKFGGSEHNNALTGFIIEEQTDLSQERWHRVEEIIPATDQAFKVPLNPGRVYSFRVLAVNAMGSSSPSYPSEKCFTSAQIPSHNPLDVKSLTVDSNTIKIVWKVVKPIDHNGPDFRYEIDWALVRDKKEFLTWEKIIIEDWEESETLLEGLLPHSLYKVKVFSVNEVGISEDASPISAYSGAEIPKASPMNLRIRRITSSSAILAWIPVPKDQVLGLLKGYQVELRSITKMNRINPNDSTQKLIVDGMASRAVLTRLLPFTMYSARVRILNNRYAGPYSKEVKFRTGQSASSEVRNLSAKPLSSDSLLVTFDPPVEPYGVIVSYLVLYQPALNESYIDTRLDNDESVAQVVTSYDELQVKLPFLNRETKYLIQVYPRNEAGLGKESVIISKTEMFPLAPPVPPIFHLEIKESNPPTTTLRTILDRDLDGDIDDLDYKLRLTILTDSNGDGEVNKDDVLDIDRDGDIDQLDVNVTDINDDGIIDRYDIYAADKDKDGDVDMYDIGDRDGNGEFDILDVLSADVDGDGDIDSEDDNGKNIILKDIDEDGDIDEDDITDIDGNGHIDDQELRALDVDNDGDVDMNDLKLADKDGDEDVDGADISDFNENGKIDEEDFKVKDVDRDGDIDRRDYLLRNVFIVDTDEDGDIDDEDVIDQDGDGNVDSNDLKISDIDGDGDLDSDDLIIGDTDGDGDVDRNDIGDINGDGVINLLDMHALIQQNNKMIHDRRLDAQESKITTIDINNDGKVNNIDFDIFDQNKDRKVNEDEFISVKGNNHRDINKDSSDSRDINRNYISDITLNAFRRLDADNNGFLDKSDLQLLDTNNDGDVDRLELKHLFKYENQVDDNQNVKNRDEDIDYSIGPIFLWDADENGVIDKNDVTDVDKDGDVDKDDFNIVDIDKDGDITDNDLTAGDVDKDGDIDFSDVGDEDQDGDIDSDDLRIADEDGDGDIDAKDDDGESIFLMDFNKDGTINEKDITDINNDGIINKADRDALDINKDGLINILDLRKGDKDGDQDIDAADIYDIDGDGDIDSNDLVASEGSTDDNINLTGRIHFRIVLADTDSDGDIDIDDVLDVNGDGNITEEDVRIVDMNKDGIINKMDVAAADRDGDGDIDRFDIGDVNNDGKINLIDILAADRDRDGNINSEYDSDGINLKFDWQPNAEKHSGSGFYIEYRPVGARIWRQSPVIKRSLRHEIDGFNPEKAYEVRMVATDGRFETPSKTKRVGPFRRVEQVKDPSLGAVMDDEPVDPLLWTWFIVSVLAAVVMLCAVFFSIWVYNHRMSRVAELRKQLYEGVETSTDEALSKDDIEAPLNGVQDVEEPLTAAKQRQMAALLRRQETTQSVDSFASQDDDFSEYGDETMGRFTDEGSLVRLNMDQ